MTDERIRQLLRDALAHSEGDYLLEDVIRFITEGKMQLWVTEQSVAVTEIVCYPRSKVLLVLLAAGDLQEIRANIPHIEAFAKNIGARRVSLCGRRGWVRALANDGFVESCTTACKEV